MSPTEFQSQNNQFDFEWLNAVVEKAKTTHKKEIEIYRLWHEYLKRSRRYGLVCRWFEKNRFAFSKKDDSKNDSVLQHDFNNAFQTYLLFIQFFHFLTPETDFESFFGDVRGGESSRSSIHQSFNNEFGLDFPFEDEMLMNYFVFGNVFKEPYPNKILRWVFLIEKQKRFSVLDLGDTLDMICTFAETTATLTLGRQPKLREYKMALKDAVKDDTWLHLSICNPYDNKDIILKQVSSLIDRKRKENPELFKKYKRKDTFQKTGRFEIPGTNLHLDELQKYLDVFDLKKAGKTNIELAEIYHPELEIYPKSEFKDRKIAKIDANEKKKADTYIGRYINKAEKIIENVENGIFPGNYQ